jgi:hypothetical protein
MKPRHAGALALVSCVLSIPATTFYGPDRLELGILTKAACAPRFVPTS